ncbi:hypothetical protein XENORESO_018224 [Xenotaenia resolanae]|uniref:Uncharacterized protein n=1 Tax=Xenotaenia resolanae TaxID=208358 RepID=A0ABV0WN14_9TELE
MVPTNRHSRADQCVIPSAFRTTLECEQLRYSGTSHCTENISTLLSLSTIFPAVMPSAQLLLSYRQKTPMVLWQFLVILTMLHSLVHFQRFNSLSAALPEWWPSG